MRLVRPPLRWHIGLMADTALTDSALVDEASRLVRYGAAVFVQAVPEESHFMLYGPGFEVRITRTDPAADYPGKSA